MIATLKKKLRGARKRIRRRRSRRAAGVLRRDAESSEKAHEIVVEVLFPGLEPRHDRSRLLGELTGTGYWEGLYLIDRLNQSLGVAGDVCEFGVAQGATSALLANEIRSTDKVLWLFDTFAGLPEPGKEDVLLDDIFDLGSADRYVGTMAYPADNVRDRLAGIGFADARIRIVKGRIEETLGGDRLPDRVCFAYLDVDLYGGTKAALEFLHTRLEPKGHVVVDDYGFFTEGPQRAVDEFLGVHPGEYQLDLPDPRAGKFCLLSRL